MSSSVADARRIVPSRVRRLASCSYGMGIVGNGATPQIADAHGGSGGVGIREAFPWVDAEAFAVPGAPVMHVPVKVFRLGYGFVKPSVRRSEEHTSELQSLAYL